MTTTETTGQKESKMTRYAVVLNEGPGRFNEYDPTLRGQYLRWSYETEATDLEALFHADNMGDRPTAAFARSLSVGDIVLDLDADEAYVVAMMGFELLIVDWPAVGATPASHAHGMRTFSRHLEMEPDSLPFWEGEDGLPVYGERHVAVEEFVAYQTALLEDSKPEPVMVREA